ncbi:MAG: glycosyltransferase [Desulfosporosinus sp.]|nr:glycosyltransferase [Desulfosporosinus sp.]
MKTVVKFLQFDYMRSSRDKREVSVLLEMGANVIILEAGEIQESKMLSNRCEYRIQKILPLSSRQNRLIRKARILKNWTMLARVLRGLDADILSCHDLTALFIGWRSTWFMPKTKRPKLVYDAHEFEVGRNTEAKRGWLKKWLIPRTERFLMKRCAFSIMVNDSIADMVQEAYQCKERPIVVRSTPPYWEIDEHVCNAQRQLYCEQMGTCDKDLQIMYFGEVRKGRGLETLLKVIKNTANCSLIIMGYGESNYIEQLKEQAIELNVANRVLYQASVPADKIWQYAGAVDISMVTIPATCPSYYYMLPNKFFESIQSLTPIIASDFPEVGRIVREYDIGLLVNPDKLEDIVAAIERLRTDKELYERFKKNLKAAKENLCWENEKKVLVEAYNAALF